MKACSKRVWAKGVGAGGESGSRAVVGPLQWIGSCCHKCCVGVSMFYYYQLCQPQQKGATWLADFMGACTPEWRFWFFWKKVLKGIYGQLSVTPAEGWASPWLHQQLSNHTYHLCTSTKVTWRAWRRPVKIVARIYKFPRRITSLSLQQFPVERCDCCELQKLCVGCAPLGVKSVIVTSESCM